MMQYYYYSILAGAGALLVALIAAFFVLKKEEGTAKMKEIANAIKEGANAYLNRQLKTIVVFAVILSILFYFMNSGASIVLAFIVGAVASYLTAYLGMSIAVRTNLRTTKAAEKGLNSAFRTAILGGSVTGFAAVGFSLIGLVRCLQCSQQYRFLCLSASVSEPRSSPCSQEWEGASSPRPLMLAQTWSARRNSTFLRTTYATRRPSRTMLETTWATAPEWLRTSSRASP